jgi:aminopeptidase
MNTLHASTAKQHIDDILSLAVQHSDAPAMVVWDAGSPLSRILAEAYCAALPSAKQLRFDEVSPEEVMAACNAMNAGGLVVLIQSSSFRLVAFRIRVELYKRGLKVIEHPHLQSMTDAEIPYYIDSLAYDSTYYRGVGRALQGRLDRVSHAVLDSGEGARLNFNCAFESAKVNIGDYTGMTNIGGQFPLGEVFTEATDLEKVSGKVRIFAFGDVTFKVNAPKIPIELSVERGRVVSVAKSTPDFDQVMELITRDEGEVWVREFGLGLNRAFSPERRVSDIGTFERVCGIHLSLGGKHNVYVKKNPGQKPAKYHVDVFAVTERVWLGDELVFQDGAWCAS